MDVNEKQSTVQLRNQLIPLFFVFDAAYHCCQLLFHHCFAGLYGIDWCNEDEKNGGRWGWEKENNYYRYQFKCDIVFDWIKRAVALVLDQRAVALL